MKLSLFNKNVTVLDYAYFDKERGIVGNSLYVDVELIGETDHEGVIFDFSLAKKKVKEIIDDKCDHRLLIPNTFSNEIEDDVEFSFTYGDRGEEIYYKCPREGICIIPDKEVNYESIQRYLEGIVLEGMPKNVRKVKLKLREEEFGHEDAVFQYTHGLKDHYGNCQRLFHGHRNTVEVFVNGEKRKDLEDYLSSELFKGHIHFVFYENVLNKDEVCDHLSSSRPMGRLNGLDLLSLKYESSQGHFEARIPGHHCFVFQSETTVENLSMEFAKIIREKVSANDEILVKAFEGIAKGAISYYG